MWGENGVCSKVCNNACCYNIKKEVLGEWPHETLSVEKNLG